MVHQLKDHIHTHNNVLSASDHKHFLDLCNKFEFEFTEPRDVFYSLESRRSHICLDRDEHRDLWNLCHKVMLKTIPQIYHHYQDILPRDDDLYDKYSGYWLCKYPEGSGISYHADLDGDAGSVTVSYAINDDYEGGELRFWKELSLEKESNSVHIYPSNFLYPHEVTPVTKGTRYSIVCWFGYQKGKDWS